jgi:UDP-glucose 4-epimerase
MSKILVTGAAGFIGSQLAHRLWQEKNELVLIDNFSYGSEDNLIFEDVDFRDVILKMDVRDRESIDRLFLNEHFDYAYHIAGITPLPDCQMNPAEAVEVNVMGTVNILEAGRRYGVGKVIFASTSAVYENNTDFPSVEEHVVPPSLIYPNTKYTAERYCQAYADVYGMNVTCLRFANVYGPHLDCLRTQPPVVGYLIREFFYDRAPVLHSTGEQRRDFIYVEDLIDLAFRVRKGTGYDVVNVSTNQTFSINELTAVVAKQMGKSNIRPIYEDSSSYWEKYPELYKGAYTISEKALEGEVVKYTLLSNEHAKQKYGWTPKVDLETGIRNTIDFSVKILEKNKSGAAR